MKENGEREYEKEGLRWGGLAVLSISIDHKASTDRESRKRQQGRQRQRERRQPEDYLLVLKASADLSVLFVIKQVNTCLEINTNLKLLS